MENKHIPGATPDVGGKQGFTGISVLYGSIDIDFGANQGGIMNLPTVTTAWKPNDEDIRELMNGGVFVLTLLSHKWPPCTVSVRKVNEVH